MVPKIDPNNLGRNQNHSKVTVIQRDVGFSILAQLKTKMNEITPSMESISFFSLRKL